MQPNDIKNNLPNDGIWQTDIKKHYRWKGSPASSGTVKNLQFSYLQCFDKNGYPLSNLPGNISTSYIFIKDHPFLHSLL